MSAPWFDHYNHRFFEILFQVIHPSHRTTSFFEFFILNPLASTWIFAATFFRFWTKQDDQTEHRRALLTKSLVALAISIVLSLFPRPLVSWPAPNSNPPYQQMFSRHLQGTGSSNCFPSHSTLVYFTIALGLWPIDRRWSTGLMSATLLCISFPRIYVGGHYPVDVVFSCVLSIAVTTAIWRWRVPEKMSDSLMRADVSSSWNWLFFLWVFELGEGFRGSELIFGAIHGWLRKH